MEPADITLLDMGELKFGDSILCRFGKRTILIDGGHLHDDRPHNGYPSLPQQLEVLLGAWPAKVDLLVVTHCHADHIGCLPKLVNSGGLTADWALLADPDLGWGKVGNLPDGTDAASAWDSTGGLDPLHAVVTAVLDDGALSVAPDREAMLADAVTMFTSYTAMIARLQADGTKVVRYGVDSHRALLKAFTDCKMKILGPSKAHLLACARYLGKIGRDALEQASAMMATDAAPDAAELFRILSDNPNFAADAGGAGAALNDQSIVLSFEIDGYRLLLTGDMQFAEAQVPELDKAMLKLREQVRKAGPYSFVKTPHHTAFNGLDAEVLKDWGPAALLAHSGGLRDPSHPERGALQDIQNLARAGAFARTDRNGQVKLDLTKAKPKLAISRGELDDFRVNPKPRVRDQEVGVGAVAPSIEPGAAPVRIEQAESGDMIEVVARIPKGIRRVTLTVDVEPRSPQPIHDDERRAPVPSFAIGGGRKLPRLLFVTSEDALARNIGDDVVKATRVAIENAGCAMHGGIAPGQSVEQAARPVQAAVRGGEYQGIVLLGGYDVVPAARLDTLTTDLRAAVGDAFPDADDFIVWSDAIYADTDDDTFAELPVSRVPDGRSAELFLAALQAGSAADPGRFCVHNAKRPFAKTLFNEMRGAGSILSSAPAAVTEARLRQHEMNGNIYLMLHGTDLDGSAFWGEDAASDRLLEAFDVSCLPKKGSGVIFTGACWGALTVTRKASAQSRDRLPQSKPVDQSIALAALRAGYRAFIGCTGSHYSPLGTKPATAGGPLHRHFWNFMRQGKAPAEALYLAKREYARRIPYDNDPIEEAVDQKIVRQFCCLGLGW